MLIEAGFPIASRGDFEAVEAIAREIKNATVAGLCRAIKRDIEASAEAIKSAPHKRIHTFISTSPLHMKYKLQMTPDAVLEAITKWVTFARHFTDDVEWSADGSRTEDDFLCRCVEAAIKAGAKTMIFATRSDMRCPMITLQNSGCLLERVPNIGRAILSTHCHNDLGLAVAIALRVSRLAHGRSNAPSTESGNAQAMRPWKSLLWRCARTRILCPIKTISKPR